MLKKIIPVKGMHCKSCEILIQREIEKISKVSKVQANFRKSQVVIYYSSPVKEKLLIEAVRSAGYEIGSDKKSWINKDTTVYKDFIIALLVLSVLFLIARRIGLTSLNFGNISQPSSLFVVLIVGLTAGISTCMALVGGLVLGISARHSEKHPESSSLEKFRPHLFFNLGRIVSFFIFGGLIGLIGKAFQLSGPVLGGLTIFVGIVMFVLGVQLLEIFPRISSATFSLPSSIEKLLGIKKRHEKEYSHTNSAIVGGLTFFLPCGFTQAMQIYAMSSGSFWSGALIMSLFALGTAPGLLAIGGFSAAVKGVFARRFFKFAGLLVIMLGLINISNGYNLTGFNIGFAKNDTRYNDPNVKQENGFQVVKMTQLSSGYSPNKFTIINNIPVKWKIEAKDPGSCSSSIVVPSQNIRKILSQGENEIDFTPQSIGDIKFSCSMGMYSGKFTVVENKNQSILATSSPSVSPSTLSTPTPVAGEQIIKATFVDPRTDIVPKEFTVEAGKPVRFEIYAQQDGRGCMGSVALPSLSAQREFLEKDKTIVFQFTPSKGEHYITCSMGSIRGKIIAN